MNVIDIAKEVFPDKDDDFYDYVIWGRTGYPCFFRKGETVEDGVRRQLLEYKEALRRDVPLCEHCNHNALPDKPLCIKCGEALTSAALIPASP